jgi:MFS family permease
VPNLSPVGLLTIHYAFYQLSSAMAGGFAGAYLLQLGFGMPVALVAFAGLLAMRFGMRTLALGVVRRLGYRRTMMLGAVLGGLQFFPLMHADSTLWLLVWLVTISLAEGLYWPVYHSAVAVTGGASRGRELGTRTAVGALVGVVGPLAGGILLSQFGPAVDFGIAAIFSVLSILPLVLLREFQAGPIPSLLGSMRGVHRTAVMAFAADGWMASGLALAWPMALFLALGSHYEAFGVANAAAGLVGAAAGLVCGRAVDRGERDRYLILVCVALGLGFALRAGAGWSPLAATIANITGAAVMGLYAPVLMSVIYDRAKQSGKAYRFHVAAEAGWDVGAASGCLVAAVVVWATASPSLAVVPAALGVLGIYWCVRTKPASAIPKHVVPAA